MKSHAPRLKATTTTLLLLVAMSCEVTACEATGSTDPDDFPKGAFTTVQSKENAFVVEVRTSPTQPPERGQTSVELVILDAQKQPVEGLKITPSVWMPDMGHGASVKPTITDEGDGKYRIDQCEFFMPGKWELTATMSGSTGDKAVVDFQIP